MVNDGHFFPRLIVLGEKQLKTKPVVSETTRQSNSDVIDWKSYGNIVCNEIATGVFRLTVHIMEQNSKCIFCSCDRALICVNHQASGARKKWQ